VKKFGGQDGRRQHHHPSARHPRYPAPTLAWQGPHPVCSLMNGRVRFHAGKLGRKYVSVDVMAEAAE
jgi:large subunit ribosomal protein L27